MAELEFKYLNEIDISDSLTDSAHVIVEDGGNIRRAPMNQLVTGGGVSSWNDLTDKPFGEETIETLFDGTVTCQEDGDIAHARMTGGDIVIGDKYVVVLDEVNYNLVGYDDDGYVVIGAAYGNFSDEMPFQIDGSGSYLTLYHTTAGDHTVKIQHITTTKLDEKFIPDTIARVSDVPDRTHWVDVEKTGNEITIVDVEEVEFSDGWMSSDIDVTNHGQLVIGETYNVVWDGVEYYDLIAFNDGGDPAVGSPYGDITEDLPFNIYTYTKDDAVYLEAGDMTSEGQSYHSFTVIGPEIEYTYNTLDERFIPDTIARVSDIPEQVQSNWNQNDSIQPDYVKNRTHWLQRDGIRLYNFTDNLDVDKGNGIYGSNATVLSSSSPKITAGETYTVVFERSSYVCTCTERMGGVTGTTKYLELGTTGLMENPSSAIPFYIKYMDGYNDGKWGRYIVAKISEPKTVNIEIYQGGSSFFPLDEKLIPDTIARKNDIPEVNYPVTSVNGMTGDVVIEAGSGGGVFIVKVTETEGEDGSYIYSADKTYEEICTAHESGKVVYAIAPQNFLNPAGYVCQLTVHNASMVKFCGIQPSEYYQTIFRWHIIAINSDDTCSYEFHNNSEADMVRVNVSLYVDEWNEDEGVYICSADVNGSIALDDALDLGYQVNVRMEYDDILYYIPLVSYNSDSRSCVFCLNVEDVYFHIYHNLETDAWWLKTYRGGTPDTTTVPDAAGETVTAAEFNALLAALREAGYLAI